MAATAQGHVARADAAQGERDLVQMTPFEDALGAGREQLGTGEGDLQSGAGLETAGWNGGLLSASRECGSEGHQRSSGFQEVAAIHGVLLPRGARGTGIFSA